MKRKNKLHAEAVEILNKPGRYVIVRQFVDGGAISTDAKDGNGYSLQEATALVAEFHAQNTSNTPKI